MHYRRYGGYVLSHQEAPSPPRDEPLPRAESPGSSHRGRHTLTRPHISTRRQDGKLVLLGLYWGKRALWYAPNGPYGYGKRYVYWGRLS
jgi:hypothetical protein